MGAHPAGADLVTRLSRRCREYEETIADLRERIDELENR